MYDYYVMYGDGQKVFIFISGGHLKVQILDMTVVGRGKHPELQGDTSYAHTEILPAPNTGLVSPCVSAN